MNENETRQIKSGDISDNHQLKMEPEIPYSNTVESSVGSETLDNNNCDGNKIEDGDSDSIEEIEYSETSSSEDEATDAENNSTEEDGESEESKRSSSASEGGSESDTSETSSESNGSSSSESEQFIEREAFSVMSNAKPLGQSLSEKFSPTYAKSPTPRAKRDGKDDALSSCRTGRDGSNMTTLKDLRKTYCINLVKSASVTKITTIDEENSVKTGIPPRKSNSATDVDSYHATTLPDNAMLKTLSLARNRRRENLKQFEATLKDFNDAQTDELITSVACTAEEISIPETVPDNTPLTIQLGCPDSHVYTCDLKTGEVTNVDSVEGSCNTDTSEFTTVSAVSAYVPSITGEYTKYTLEDDVGSISKDENEFEKSCHENQSDEVQGEHLSNKNDEHDLMDLNHELQYKEINNCFQKVNATKPGDKGGSEVVTTLPPPSPKKAHRQQRTACIRSPVNPMLHTCSDDKISHIKSPGKERKLVKSPEKDRKLEKSPGKERKLVKSPEKDCKLVKSPKKDRKLGQISKTRYKEGSLHQVQTPKKSAVHKRHAGTKAKTKVKVRCSPVKEINRSSSPIVKDTDSRTSPSVTPSCSRISNAERLASIKQKLQEVESENKVLKKERKQLKAIAGELKQRFKEATEWSRKWRERAWTSELNAILMKKTMTKAIEDEASHREEIEVMIKELATYREEVLHLQSLTVQCPYWNKQNTNSPPLKKTERRSSGDNKLVPSTKTVVTRKSTSEPLVKTHPGMIDTVKAYSKETGPKKPVQNNKKKGLKGNVKPFWDLWHKQHNDKKK